MACNEIVRTAQQRQSFVVDTLNMDHLVNLRRVESFCNAYSFVTADGAIALIKSTRRIEPHEKCISDIGTRTGTNSNAVEILPARA